MASIDFPIPDLETIDDEIESANTHLEHACETLNEAGEGLKVKMGNLQSATEHLAYAISSLDRAKENLAPAAISVVADNLDFAQSHIDFAKYDLDYDIMNFLELLFKRLEARVEEAQTVSNELRLYNQYL
jgi:hypothetical protein